MMQATLQEQLKQAAKALDLPVPIDDAENKREATADLDLIVNALSNGGKALIFGAKASNFTYQMRQHPQFIWFDSTDPKAASRGIPVNVRIVLVCDRWHEHVPEAVLRKEARRRNIPCPPGWYKTGVVREMIQRYIDKPQPVAVTKVAENAFTTITPVMIETPVTLKPITVTPDPMPVVAQEQMDEPVVIPTMRKPEKGELMAAIVRHKADPDKARNEEARRIYVAMKLEGISTTEGSIANGIYRAIEQGLIGSAPTTKEQNDRWQKTQTQAIVVPPVKAVPVIEQQDALTTQIETQAIVVPPVKAVPVIEQQDALTTQIGKFKTLLAEQRAAIELMEGELAALEQAVEQERRKRVAARLALQDYLT